MTDWQDTVYAFKLPKYAGKILTVTTVYYTKKERLSRLKVIILWLVAAALGATSFRSLYNVVGVKFAADFFNLLRLHLTSGAAVSFSTQENVMGFFIIHPFLFVNVFTQFCGFIFINTCRGKGWNRLVQFLEASNNHQTRQGIPFEDRPFPW